ncbi:NAD-dependent epimerase/dehydratase family protein [Phytoactinopolyspora endophytica]|uniref:NAD-dependent epimerase/dehydratase family protein n=1 Tax=Phytoactinopolyspora endophytica TaxID=1642495 RepID=UPI00101B5D40|nr:NAD-dependent epimerase/dehydratase family protein [Phytoactinopolyspora endophytica]
MRALVTGGAGFIGSHLAERVLMQGHQVVALDDMSTGDADNLAHLNDHLGFELVKGSILDAALVDDLVEASDVAFHLAAAVGVHLILNRSLDGLRTNVHGTENVLQSAARHGTRTVLASTSEVYGKSTAPILCEDQDRILGSPLVKRWSYAEAKALDETLAFLLFSEHGAPIVIARLFNVTGPRQTGRYGMVMPRFVDLAMRGRPLTVYGDGSQTRSFCHVYDAADGLIALAEQPDAYGGVFNIGRPEEVSIRELAERVIRLTGSASTIRYVAYAQAYGDGFEDTMRRVPDISRARELIGFDPALCLDDIILSIVDEFRLSAWARSGGGAARPARPRAARSGGGRVR